MPKEETITIPMNLARLLISRPSDLKDPDKFEDLRSVGIGLLRVLVESKG